MGCLFSSPKPQENHPRPSNRAYTSSTTVISKSPLASQSQRPTSSRTDPIAKSSSKPQERPQSSGSYINHSTSVEAFIRSSLKNEELIKKSLKEPKQSLKPSLPTPTPKSITPSLKPSGGIHNSKSSPAIKYVEKPQLSKTDTSLSLSLSPISSAPVRPAFEPTPISASQPYSSPPNASKKTNYVWVQKSTTPLFAVPEDFRELIMKDIAPQVLGNNLTPMTYKNYFKALLYAEDVYCEKWSDYCLENVTVELHGATMYKKSSNKNFIDDGSDDKVFVAFQMDSIPQKRPFILSRDFVLLRPSGMAVEPFQGIIYRVVNSTHVLAEFGDDFHLQHITMRKYDVSFSFNRVCLKRCHQAITAATDTLSHNFLFPKPKCRTGGFEPPCVIPFHRNLNQKQLSAVDKITRLNSPPPFLLEGPLSVIFGARRETKLSETGIVIKEAVQQIYWTYPSCRILVSAPTNSVCDVMMRSLKEAIPESEILRANAAFRDLDEVPSDILPFCPVEGEIFTCPPLRKLREFRVVLSTFMSSFRLHSEGITRGHFSHIFLVDASSTIEPETLVPLARLVDESTVVVVTGAIGNCSRWVRSVIAREYGLKRSYFQRLLESGPYCRFDPRFVARLGGSSAQLN